MIENRAVAERARAGFHAPVEARNHLARRDERGNLRLDRRVLRRRQLSAAQRVADFLDRELGTEEDIVEWLIDPRAVARGVLEQRRAGAAAAVSHVRMDEHLL